MEYKPMVEEVTVPTEEPVDLGTYIVSDPKICYGTPTFRGTRIMVWQILEQLAAGTPWDEIEQLWDGRISAPAIREAASVASLAFKNKAVVEALDGEADWRQLTSYPVPPEEDEPTSSRIELGAYVVADSRICHGKPTFRGFRIMVWQILSEVSEGMSWDEISVCWDGKVTALAVEEALRLASRVFGNRAAVPAVSAQAA
jgi:uncharacterized protein (DUF433 family)